MKHIHFLKKLVFLYILVSLSIVSHSQTYVPHKWGAVAMGGGGFVSAVITCPTQKNLIYARTDVGGAYRWDEATKSWIPLNYMISQEDVGLLGIESLAIDPQAPQNIYMLAGTDYFSGGKTAILRSNDNGNSFTIINVTDQFKAHGNGMGRQNGERLAVDPQNSSILYCGSRKNGLFKSIDAGLTWKRIESLNITTTPNNNGICAVVFDKASGKIGEETKTIYVAVSQMGTQNVYVSNDAGVSWSALANQPTNYMPQRLVLASDGNLYIPYGNGAGPNATVAEPMDAGALWKYNTVSKTWTNITPTGITRAFGSVSIDASNPNKIIASTASSWLQQPWGWGDHIFVSENGGTSWTNLFTTNNVTMDVNGMGWIANHAIHWVGSIEIDPFNSDRFFITSGNGLFASENMNARPLTIKFMAKGIEETVPFDITNTSGNQLISVIGDYDGFNHTNVLTFPTQAHQPGMGSTYGLAAAPLARNIVVRAGADICLTENSGFTWTKLNEPVAGGTGEVCVSADGSSILWSLSASTTTYYTKNKGVAWTACTGLDFANAPAADYVNTNKIYSYNPTNGYVYISTDAGATFTQAGLAGTGGSLTLRTVPGIEGGVWVALGDKGLVKSVNSGTTFTAIANVNSCNAIGFGKAAPGQTFPVVYIWGKANGGSIGIYRSIDGGVIWQRVNDEQHQFGGPGNGAMVKGDLDIYGRVYMTTVGLGMIYGDVITETTCEYPDLGLDKFICESYNVTLDTKISQAGYTFEWLKNDEPLSFTTSSIIVSEPAVYKVNVKKSGCPDVFDYIQVKSNLLQIIHDSVCPSTEATLTTIGTGNYNWYNSTVSNTVITTGNTYTFTPTATTSYYVQDMQSTPYSLGLPNYTTGGWGLGSGFNDNQNRIKMTIVSTVRFKSLAIQVINPTNAVINITDELGNIVKTVSAAGLTAGKRTITIDYVLSAGTYYIDAVGTTGYIQFQSDKTASVWSISNYVTLSQLSGWAYGIFFDISFEVGNVCLRTPVTAVVKTNCLPSTITQTINLQKGWNLISTNVHPTDSTIETLFSGLDVAQIKDMNGFWKNGQASPLNSLQSITAGQGYLVNMNTAGNLTISGTVKKIHEFSLQSGWNLIGYPGCTDAMHCVSTPISNYFNTTNCQTIKNFDGFWEPSGGANSIQDFEVGKGYFLKK